MFRKSPLSVCVKQSEEAKQPRTHAAGECRMTCSRNVRLLHRAKCILCQAGKRTSCGSPPAR
jgi:hypothetical protein